MKNGIFIIASALIFALPSYAYISSSETYSSEFLKINGYSDSTVSMVGHERNKAAGLPNEPLNNKLIRNRFLRILYNSYTYTDPAAEDDTFLNHNIHMVPSVEDL